jgi:RecB family exonuclease
VTSPVNTSEQLSFGGMPQRLYSCTPTRLTTWLDCPRRYRMSYLDRPVPSKGGPWAHNSVGASVHNALAAWWRLPLARRSPSVAGDLLDQGWINQGFADEAQSARQRVRARAMVEGYAATLDPADEPVGVERTVATRTDRIALSGRIDRLDDRPFPEPAEDAADEEAADAPPTDGTELVVVDYKTGRHLLTTDDARSSLALAVYAVAAARSLRRTCHRVELHHLPTGTVLAWEHTDDTLARHIRRAEDIASECAEADDAFRAGLPAERYDEVFPPRTGPTCGWCDFRQHCPQGQAASSSRKPWDGLADEEP